MTDVKAARVHEAGNGAGVRIAALEGTDDFEQAERLFKLVWRIRDDPAPVNRDLMRALAHTGNYVAGAFDRDDVLVGACVAFFGPPPSQQLHSHIAGVLPHAQGQGVGRLLKQHQHIWAARRGLRHVTWTFDPLVRRNAYFNIAKLGARPTAYLADFYGSMGGINAGQGSDRLLVSWRVTDGSRPDPGRASASGSGGTVLLDVAADGGPVVRSCDPGTREVLVATPSDIAALRAGDPAAALAWRHSVRETLGALLAEGAVVSGFTRGGHYVLERKTA